MNQQIFQEADVYPVEGKTDEVIQPGQWRLARLELVNWGTFGGYKVLPIDRRGFLITGESGSGKSTLLDAITTVLTPPRSRHLNAAARTGNVRGEDRTICSYVRGAWRSQEADGTGEIVKSYLRPNSATWSGIMLRYECGLEESVDRATSSKSKKRPVNLIALFNQKAGSNTPDGLKTMYVVARGDFCLNDFRTYAENGIDIGKLKKDFKDIAQAYREHSQFANAFCRIMGIRSTKTLELLHKTQAAKNFGSLDDLFRKFMLDDPQTFDQADAAVEQFSALAQAHEGVVELRKQMECLEPVIQLDEDHQKAKDDIERYSRLKASLESFTTKVIIDFQEEEKEKLQSKIDRCHERVEATKSEVDLANQSLTQAEAILNKAGGLALDTAKSDLYSCENQLNNVKTNRTRLEADLKCADIDRLPDTYSEWEELRRKVKKQAEAAIKQQMMQKDEDYKSYGNVSAIQRKLDAAATELRHLRSRKTNIPLSLHEVRLDIARHLSLETDELPFIAEMIRVRPEAATWQGAIERLLGQQAKTLLVAQRHVKAVSNYLENKHVGLRLEYQAVPLENEVSNRSLAGNSVIRKLEVKKHKRHKEFTDWINKDLRDRFNYACVESPDEFDYYDYALSMGGQVKRKNRYIKDDRHAIDDKRNWILGDDNEKKINRLEQDEKKLQKALKKAEETALAISKQHEKVQDIRRLSAVLVDAPWASYDLEIVSKDYQAARGHYEFLRQNNDKMSKAEKLRDEARVRKEAADKAYQEARIEEGKVEDALKGIAEDIEAYQSQLHQMILPLPEEHEQLAKYFKKVNKKFRKSKDAINQTSRAVLTKINEKEQSAIAAVQKTRNAAERIFYEFRQTWPVVAVDLSADFADKDAYIAIYKRIKGNGLPEYEQKFLEVLHEFSQDQITVMASTIRRAFREVKEKLIPVNKSLELSEYSKGVYLHIEAKDSKSKQVHDFLSELKAITEDAWSDDDLEAAERRFERTARIIKKLSSGESADRTWRQACLDTRQHVNFIAKEIDKEGNVQGVHSSDAGLSGGQKQKLVIFCLAAALRYQLADEDQPIPSYGTVILDEAFDKADQRFAGTAMDIFEVFGFHMVLATPLKLLQTLEQYIGAIASVVCQDSKHSSFHLIPIEHLSAEER